MDRFVSGCCEGERCHCGKPASNKVEETVFHDDPLPNRHPYTTYLCADHFDHIMHPTRSRDPAVGTPWPEPKVTNPDIANPTGVPYLDCLIHRLLDAQQDLNWFANAEMHQSLADAATLMDEVETALRIAASRPVPSPAPVEREVYARALCDADLWPGAWNEQKAAVEAAGHVWHGDSRAMNYLRGADAILALASQPAPASNLQTKKENTDG